MSNNNHDAAAVEAIVNRIREEFVIVSKIGPCACINSAMMNVDPLTEIIADLRARCEALESASVDIGGIGGSQDSPSPLKAVALIADLRARCEALERDLASNIALVKSEVKNAQRAEAERDAAIAAKEKAEQEKEHNILHAIEWRTEVLSLHADRDTLQARVAELSERIVRTEDIYARKSQAAQDEMGKKSATIKRLAELLRSVWRDDCGGICVDPNDADWFKEREAALSEVEGKS